MFLMIRSLTALAFIAFTCIGMAQQTSQTPEASASGAPEANLPAVPNVLPRNIKIPHLTFVPSIGQFENMQAQGPAKQMIRISDFTQTSPANGAEPSERTDLYLGYTDQAIVVVWVCFDDLSKVRAHIDRRENIYDDDYVQITLDPFHDQRHAFVFGSNPLGVQADGLWTEGTNNNPDNTWDAIWESEGKLTSQGYIVWEEIPFKSLRFRGQSAGLWGITLIRNIQRMGEQDVWPFVSSRINGFLSQEGTLSGISGVEAGHGFEFNPYMEGRSFHALDTSDPANPRYSNRLLNGKLGIDDTKFVFHDSLVLDATVNPDFAQVESDQPQNTINQRFEVYFPEKRPFFLENANYFNIPGSPPVGGTGTTLVFTRRIADPDLGIRLTGKDGPFNIGFLMADDKAPGESVLRGNPLFHKRAQFYIARVAYDVGKNSSIGVIYTGREFAGSFNRVGGVDARFKLSQHWNTSFHAVLSSTTAPGAYSFGQDHEFEVDGQGLRYFDVFSYQDITPGFNTETGFLRRTDIRHVQNYYHFYWRPNSKRFTLHGPEFAVERMWDHTNRGIEYNVNGDWAFLWRNNTLVAPIVGIESDTLRPQDFPGLPFDKKFIQDFWGLVFRGAPNRLITWSTQLIRGGTVDIVVPKGQLPVEGDETSLNQTITVRPLNALTIANTYIWDRVDHSPIHRSVFNNHIIRSESNYQFTRALSLRFIAQYNGLLSDPIYSSLPKTKDLNFDFLLTYLAHPGTAIYVGYNSNLENIDPGLCVHLPGTTECDPNGSGLLRNNRFLNDGKQVFVKISYLFRK